MSSFHDLLVELLARLESGHNVAYCRLVETRGSTPQKSGATMLVFADGSQAGTLGGGCVEAEVKRRALASLAQATAEIASFQLDSDYGWDDGLICGGRMQVLIDPLRPQDDVGYFRRLLERIEAGQGSMEAVAYDAAKVSIAIPACWLLDESGRVLESRHVERTAAVPATLLEHLPALGERPRPTAQHGITYLPQLPRCRLLIVGGGHIGQSVAQLAAEVDFDVWVLDDRPEYITTDRFPKAVERLCGPIGETLSALKITSETYCLIVTRGHNHDEEALYHLCNRGACYVGMIGSRRKIKLIFDDLESQGISPEVLAKVYAPLGIEIGSQTVMEITISILAELIAHRNRHGEIPGRPASVYSTEPR